MKKGQVKIYRGVRRPRFLAEVTVDGKLLPVRLDLANHSPSGFEWGYQGSGPSQLALAMLADAFGDAFALVHYVHFKCKVIARLQADYWTLALSNYDRDRLAVEYEAELAASRSRQHG